ncbi:hypothetical protein HER14_00415 [Acidithiobacillus thiooxidans]|uniref:flagellin N-terminal helical domain-containing protein n=1 Tax=Acidithiobacillus TaxID=119977 RepID=UPI0018790D99|nr:MULTISPECIES: flagellin [Acidithiobacillus]MBE7565538.1 hypothetical protein [Acidithiobacillus sp. HP-11]MBU2749474.1 hypothetical protein [Acidithiobacillus thiooxidans]MBU2792083.1 hypothetical protein [Acidithiobacillus thiooxidans]
MAISGVINTNTSTLNTLDALNGTQGGLDTYLQQLSTGKRINSPADNPADYAIAQRFQTQINGLNQAIANGNQGVSLVQTATGAVQNQINLLQQIRTTAVQAANASNTTSDRQALQGVVSQLLAQVQTIATQTQFNGQNLLDGTFAGTAFQVGANSNQIINAAVGNAQTSAMGDHIPAVSPYSDSYGCNGSFVSGGFAPGGAFTITPAQTSAYFTFSGGSYDFYIFRGLQNGGEIGSKIKVTLTGNPPDTQELNKMAAAISSAGIKISGTTQLVNGTPVLKLTYPANDKGISFSGPPYVTSGSYDYNSQTNEITVTLPDSAPHLNSLLSAVNQNVVSVTKTGSSTQLTYPASGQRYAFIEDSNITQNPPIINSSSGSITYTQNNGGSAMAPDSTGMFQEVHIENDAFSSRGTLITSNTPASEAIIPPNTYYGSFSSGTGSSGLSIQGPFGSAQVDVNTETESAASITTAVNAVSQQTGVKARAYTSASFLVATGSYTFTLSNGSSGLPRNAVNISASVNNAANGQPNLNALLTAVNQHTAVTGIAASSRVINGKPELILTNANGENINISAGLANGQLASTALAAGSTGSLQAVSGSTQALIGYPINSGSHAALIQGAVQFASASAYRINNGDMIGFSSQVSRLQSGSALADIDVSTQEGAQRTITIVDQALNYLNQQASELGATQTRIQVSVVNDQSSATNMQSAQSTVQDASIAQATSQLTKYQILQQAGISTLAQENALQQAYLKLLPSG